MGGFIPNYGILPQMRQPDFNMLGVNPLDYFNLPNAPSPRSYDFSGWDFSNYDLNKPKSYEVKDFTRKSSSADLFRALIEKSIEDESDNEYKRKLRQVITQSPSEYAQSTIDDYTNRGGGKMSTILREALVAIGKGPEYIPITEQLRANSMKDYMLQSERLKHASDMDRVKKEILPRLISGLNAQELMEGRMQTEYAKLQEKANNDDNRAMAQYETNLWRKQKLGLEEQVVRANALAQQRNVPLDMIYKQLAGGVWNPVTRDYEDYDVELYGQLTLLSKGGQGRGDTTRTSVSQVPRVVRVGDEDKLVWTETRNSTTYQNNSPGQQLRDQILNRLRNNSTTPSSSNSPLTSPINKLPSMQMDTGGSLPPAQPTPQPTGPTSNILPRLRNTPASSPRSSSSKALPVLTPENIGNYDVRGATNYNQQSTEQKDMIGKLTSATGLAMDEYLKWTKSGRNPNVGIARYTGGVQMREGGMNTLLSGGHSVQEWMRKNASAYTGVGKSTEEMGIDMLVDDAVATNIFGRGGKTLTDNEIKFFENTRPRKVQPAEEFLKNSLIYTFGAALLKFKERHGLTRDSKYDDTGLLKAITENVDTIKEALDKGLDPKQLNIPTIADSFYATYFGIDGEERKQPKGSNSGKTPKGRPYVIKR